MPRNEMKTFKAENNILEYIENNFGMFYKITKQSKSVNLKITLMPFKKKLVEFKYDSGKETQKGTLSLKKLKSYSQVYLSFIIFLTSKKMKRHQISFEYIQKKSKEKSN
mmetsp:Transcript_25094/g.24559  ORF Transcript_25094/g.24559 Transcript_25094/m.24559 type:complete len:109 (+) Transcript_25094:1132-1458(+)